MLKYLFLIATVFLNISCATKFLVPANRFMISESSGDLLKGDFKGGFAGTGQVQIADDVTSASPDLTPVLSRNSSMYAGADLGLASHLDIYYTGVVQAPGFVGLKVQVLGNPRSSAKAGNFSLALAGGTGFGNLKQSSESSGIKGESTIKFSGWEALLLLGFRPSDNFLIYTAPFKSQINASCDIKRTVNDVTTTTASPDGFGETSGVNLGMRWGTNFFLNIEGTYMQSNWTREQPSAVKADTLSSVVYGAAIGGAW